MILDINIIKNVYDAEEIISQTGQNSLTFSVVNDDTGLSCLDEILVEGRKYIIEEIEKTTSGRNDITYYQCIGEFSSLKNENFTKVLNGDYTLKSAIEEIFNFFGWKVVFIGKDVDVNLENTGYDNPISLLDNFCSSYNLSIYPNVEKKILKIIKDNENHNEIVFRYGYNMKTLKVMHSITNLFTYRTGINEYEKTIELDDGESTTETIRNEVSVIDEESYKIWGRRDAPILEYSDENMTKEKLTQTLKTSLGHYTKPEITMEVELNSLKNTTNIENIEVGNVVTVICEEWGGFRVDVQVSEIKYYPRTNETPVVTLSNVTYKQLSLIELYKNIKK